MNDAKQLLLLEYLISSADTFSLTRSLIKPHFFEPDLRGSISWINEYFDKYNALPTPAQVKAETGLTLTTHTLTKPEIKYCTEEIEQFCRRKALQQAIIDAPALIKAGEYGQLEKNVRDALLLSLSKNVGLDYYAAPLDRLEDMLVEAPRVPTGFGPQFDDLIGGGLARTEMMLFTANSGGGKSIALANLAINFSQLGLNALYISLELSENMIAQRFDQMLTGVSSFAWRDNYESIATSITKQAQTAGSLVIHRMHVGTNAIQIRSFLKEYELKFGFVPDLLVIDYLDLMGPNEKMSADNVSEKDKRSTEQLRDIGFDYNMYIATASQQNRTAVDAAVITQAHIAGGLTKINTVDVAVSIILSPKMKAAGEIGFTFTKTRSSDGVGKTTMCEWDNKYLRIRPPTRPMSPPEQDPVQSKYKAGNKSAASPMLSLEDVLARHAG